MLSGMVWGNCWGIGSDIRIVISVIGSVVSTLCRWFRGIFL